MKHFLVATLFTLPAAAQVPNTLLHSIPAPPSGVQSGAGLGYGVAVDGAYAVCGAPFDDTGATDSGVVKVFHTVSGALLRVISNPNPRANNQFGLAVAISGTRLAVLTDDGPGGQYQQQVFVFDLAAAQPAVPVAVLGTGSGATVVVMSGSRVAVGNHNAAGTNGSVGAGNVYVYDLAGPAPLVPLIIPNPTPQAGDHFGWSVGLSGAWLVTGAINDNTGDIQAGSACVYDLGGLSPTVPLVTINDPTPAFSGQFASSVGISGTRVIVSDHREAVGGVSGAGRAYLYDLAGATPAVPAATLDTPAPETNGNFGNTVGITGTLALAGSYREDVGATFDAGKVYFFDVSGPVPAAPVIINNPGPAQDDQFSWALAVSGNRAIVGAYQDDTGAANAGSAYVYELAPPAPGNSPVTLNHPGPGPGDRFGTSVAIAANRVIAGAPLDDTAGLEAGRVFVHDLTTDPAAPALILQDPQPAGNRRFGNSVAADGNLVVAGLPEDAIGGSGQAFVYDLQGNTPAVPVLSLNNPVPAAFDRFGHAIAVSGTRIAVGAPTDDTVGNNAGSVYIYDRTNPSPATPVLTLSNPVAAGGAFGWAVAISGNILAVGARENDPGGINNAGTVYVYNLSGPTPSVPVHTLNNPAPAVNDAFGSAVSLSGTRLVSGTPNDLGRSGSVTVYNLAGATPATPVATLNNPVAETDAGFGTSVALSAAGLLVGSPGASSGGVRAGVVYFYDVTGTPSATPTTVINNPHPLPNDAFGTSVALSGGLAVIGAPFDGITMVSKGAVYVFGPVTADLDADGLHDLWERIHFGHAGTYTAADDPDRDGQSNGVEFSTLTDPVNSASFFTPSVASDGPNLVVSFLSAAGRSYTLWRSDTLTPGSWSNTGLPAVAGDGGVKSFTVPASAHGRMCFRIQAVP